MQGLFIENMKKERWGSLGKNICAMKWIKAKKFENLKKMVVHEQQTFLGKNTLPVDLVVHFKEL